MARSMLCRTSVPFVSLLLLLAWLVLPAAAVDAAPSVWSVTPSPNTANDNVLNGVSCTSSVFCVAVGYHDTSKGVSKTLVELWNGTAWSIVSSPDRGKSSNELNAVSCKSTTFCVAVGDYSSHGFDTLVEMWNGSHWSLTTSPEADLYTDLYGVSCTSTRFCEAVGYYTNTAMEGTLVETWNGTSWSITPSPNPSITATAYRGVNALNGVSCTSARFCEAAGYDNNSSNVARSLVEKWNGSAWSVATTHDKGSGTNTLDGVSCKSPTFCVAVGDYASGGFFDTLVETWDGSSWSITASPNPSDDNYLYGASCTSSSSCVAVGYYANPAVTQTIVESWDGTGWSTTSSPDPSKGSFLRGVSCTTASHCVAVGDYSNGSVDQTLVETGSS